MIFLDTNVVVDYLHSQSSLSDTPRMEAVYGLFADIEAGREKALVSEVVLHECFYVLVMRLKVATVPSFCAAFRDILSWSGWAINVSEMSIFRSALDILEAHPKLEFSDAAIAARAWAHDAKLATFDSRLADAYGGTRWADS